MEEPGRRHLESLPTTTTTFTFFVTSARLYLMIPMDTASFHLPTTLVHYLFSSISVVSKELFLAGRIHMQT
jgi:hypothetical protein